MKKTWPVLGIIICSLFIMSRTYSGPMNSSKKVFNAGEPLNTLGDDFSPSLSGDGRIMVFNSRLPDEQDHNLYISHYVDGRWTTPKFMKKINTRFNEETPYITPDGKTLVFASDRPGSRRPSQTADGIVRITFDIYISQNIDGLWTGPVPVAGDVNTTRNERSPSLSNDKRTLYFCRWRFKNIRDSKIMKASLRDRRYVDSRPLPFPVNTGNYDIAFVPSKRKAGYYFASRREGGFGGWDLYFVAEKDGFFTDVINLGSGINSSDNELFLTEADGHIYFCSNRYGSMGRYDIFAAKIPSRLSKYDLPEKPVFTTPPLKPGPGRKIPEKRPADKKPEIKPVEKKTDITAEKKTPAGNEKITTPASPHQDTVKQTEDKRTRIYLTVINSKTDKPLSVPVKVYLKNTDDPRALPLRTATRNSDASGFLRVFPKSDVTHVVVKINQKGFMHLRKSIKVEPHKLREVKLKLVPRDKKSLSVFYPVYFDTGSSRIRMVFYPHLYDILEHLRSNPDIRLRIIGHSDKRGSPAYNRDLSLRRARAVRDYFRKMGLDVCSFEVAGEGEKKASRRYDKNSYELDRRVEFEIIP